MSDAAAGMFITAVIFLEMTPAINAIRFVWYCDIWNWKGLGQRLEACVGLSRQVITIFMKEI
jgi:hypothetical protein